MLDLVGNPEDRFSHNKAQIICFTATCVMTNPIIAEIVTKQNLEPKVNGFLAQARVKLSRKLVNISTDTEVTCA